MFIDSKGESWDTRIDVSVIRRVRAEHGIDLSKVISSQEQLSALNDDIVLLVDVLYAVCKPVADSRKIDAEEFAMRLSGNAIESAVESLMLSIIDFFPQSRSKILRQIWDKTKEIQTQKLSQVQQAVDQWISTSLSTPTLDTPSATQKEKHSGN